MNDEQYVVLSFALLFLLILLILELGMMTICERLKEIRRLLEKITEKLPPKGE